MHRGRTLIGGIAGLRQTLRITPAGHGSAKGGGDVHDETSLTSNPYTPFWMVWKPARPWSKAKWAKGSSEGLAVQPPDYAVAVVEWVPTEKGEIIR